MSDPFRVSGPAYVSLSGGRTSAYMLRRVLDAHGGELPHGCHVLFANTGKERPETLDFVDEVSRRWAVPIKWLEYDGRDGKLDLRLTTYEDACRDGEPFAQLIAAKKYLPNQAHRLCTETLKVRRLRAWMRHAGYDAWTALVGLRADEPRRVAKVRGRDADDEEATALPLADARVTRADVMAFWAAQPFDLRLNWWESNCDGCFLKGEDIRERVERDHPGALAWWAARETEVGARFTKHGASYATLIARAGRPSLPVVLDESSAEGMACACTD